jgi:hypothetical protein
MQKNSNLSQLDTDQIVKRKFDEDHDADRVILVGQELSIDSNKIAQAIQEGMSKYQFTLEQTPIMQQQIQTIKENVFIPQIEIREIEKQVFIPLIEYRTIEVPVVTEKIITIEKPIIIKEIEIREIEKERYYPFVMKASAVIQALAVISLIIINLLKK